jgi:hypothetical protein
MLFSDATFIMTLHLQLVKVFKLTLYYMKKWIVYCALLCLFASCTLGDDGTPNYHFEILPIESVDIPDEFTLGETYPITVSYNKPSSCYVFNDFYYVSELNQRTVAVINTVYEDQVCTQAVEMVDATFNFMVTSNGTYVFKFWQGEDDNGNDLYYIVEVPVVE